MNRMLDILLTDDNPINPKTSDVKIRKGEDDSNIIIDFDNALQLIMPGDIRGIIGDPDNLNKQATITLKVRKDKIYIQPDTPKTIEQMKQLVYHNLYPVNNNEQFKRDALRLLDIADHPKASKAFELAWRQSGYYEVLTTLSTFVELLEDD